MTIEPETIAVSQSVRLSVLAAVVFLESLESVSKGFGFLWRPHVSAPLSLSLPVAVAVAAVSSRSKQPGTVTVEQVASPLLLTIPFKFSLNRRHLEKDYLLKLFFFFFILIERVTQTKGQPNIL